MNSSYKGAFVTSLIAIVLSTCGAAAAAGDLSLDEAIEIALHRTGRGEIIDGNLEVAEQNYFAEKINFYVPEISINGSLPAYNERESYDFLPGTDEKVLGTNTNFDFDADITLKQSLITGGDFTLRANLVNNDWKYPVQDRITQVNGADTTYLYSSRTVDEKRNLGTFNFALTQPILKPSEAKHALNNKRDDLEIARLAKAEETAALKKEVVEAYFGVLQTRLMVELSEDNFRLARLKAEIDSVKLMDGVISEEDWLESSSQRLDAELMKFDNDNAALEQWRTLVTLLDLPTSEDVNPVIPEVTDHPTDSRMHSYIDRWEECATIRKAWHEYRKAERQAEYTASSYGLSGVITASYGLERGTVEDDRSLAMESQDLNTDSWGIKLDLSYPLWDGGAASASVKAARLSSEKSRLEHEKAEKAARAEIENLVNRINVSYRKSGLLEKQVELGRDKLDIAKYRWDDGQISELTYLENRVSFLEARDKYLEELKSYYLARADLDGKFAD